MTNTTISFPPGGSGTATLTAGTPRGRQGINFCIENGLVHAWRRPDIGVWPGPTIRYCENCGRQQKLVPEYWEDVSPP